MTTNIYPRVLVIGSAPLGRQDATGITLTNLFAGWPKESIAQIYDSNLYPSDEVCVNYRRFSGSEIGLIRLFKLVVSFTKKKFLKLQSEIKHEKVVSFPAQGSSLSIFSAYADIVPFDLPQDIIDWLDQYQPEVIYTVLGSVRMMNIVLKVSGKYSIPIVPHFMDDWPGTLYMNSPFLVLPRKILVSKLKSILEKAPERLTICDEMAVEFTRRYSGVFDSYMNCVEMSALDNVLKEAGRGCVKFGYVGGLHLSRWRSLLSVVTALQSLKDAGNNLCLEIYSPARDLSMFGALFRKFTVVEVTSTLAAEEVNNHLRGLDVLVHVESFEPHDSLYTRYSISTKIPQYMASGKPILAHGPENISSIQYVKTSGSGLTIVEKDGVDALITAAKSLYQSDNLRIKLGQKGRDIAAISHNAIIVRKRFLSCIRRAVAHNLKDSSN